MPETPFQRIVIVGGGSAGWMAAAGLSQHLDRKGYPIRLVESDDIATVGVGEATVPPLREFNRRLQLDENAFVQATNGSFKLGILFENWGNIGDSYSHPFGPFGHPINGVGFQHFWLRRRATGDTTSFFDFNFPHVALMRNRFSLQANRTEALDLNYHYAYHFDAALYAAFLRKYAEAHGVIRTEGKVVDVLLHSESGDIAAILLESGERIEGDLFIDCTGFRARLIEEALHTGWDDWSHWLPCNRAWAVATHQPAAVDSIPPYTRARALQAGWQWRIPLQSRTGNGHIFCSEYMDEERGRQVLLDNVEGEPMFEPRLLKFTTGARKRSWNRNCVAIGLASGFLEPLESTSIHLIQVAILQLLRYIPGGNAGHAERDDFNRVMAMNYEESRDFLMLHYNATARNDTAFWDYCRNMTIPEELRRRVELFRESGTVAFNPYILFAEHSWLALLIGQGIVPRRYNPRADEEDEKKLATLLELWRDHILRAVEGLPGHAETLAMYCGGDLKVRQP